MKRKLSFFAVCCTLLFSGNISAAEIEQNDGYSYLKRCLQTDQRAQPPFPSQIIYASPLVDYLWFSHYANTFPFGIGQPAYIRQEKLKKISFGSLVISFDKNGRVTQFDTIPIEYSNDFPVQIGNVSFDPKTGILSSPVQAKFDENCSFIEFSQGEYWLKYRQDSTGTIREIEEPHQDTVGPYGSAKVVQKSVTYRATSAQPKIYPLRADPVDVIITNPYYLNFIQPFIFQSDGITFSERRVVKPGHVGRGERPLSYKVDGNRIIRMPTRHGDVDITWTKDGPTGLSGNFQKISLEYTDAGQITSARYNSGLFPDYAFRSGALIIKRNGQGEIIRAEYLNKPYILDKALFDYYD